MAGFSFGSATTTTTAAAAGSTGFGSAFGAAPSAGGTSAFGAAPAARTTTGFGGVAASTGFGATPAVGGTSAFGSATGGAFGGTTAFNTNTQAAQAATAAQPATPEAVYAAAVRCNVFGDDRDALVARWNLLQASWESGRIYATATTPPMTVDQTNPVARFKAIGYSKIPESASSDTAAAEVSLIFKMKLSALEPLKDQLVTSLHQVMGSKPNLKVMVDTIRAHGHADEAAEAVIHVLEAGNLGATRKVPASELHAFLTSPASTQALQKLNIIKVLPKASFTTKQIKDYCETPQMGVDPRLWAQAQMDNPDPSKLIPVPLLGFKALQSRVKSQEVQAKQQQDKVNNVAEVVLDLKKRHLEAMAKMADLKRHHFELAHRVLKVIVAQETTRKLGFAIQYDEEKIGARLETLQGQLSIPTQYKGRISELLSQLRFMHNGAAGGGSGGSTVAVNLESFVQCDIQALLKQQQDGIAALVQMTKQDLGDLQKIAE